MYSVSHGKMKTTEPGTDLKAEGPLGVASLLVGAWAVPQRPNAWVFDSTCGKTLDELNKLVLSLPATIAPKPIARPRLDSDGRACRTVPEEHLLRPIVGEQLVLAKRSRENSGRAQQARLESSRNHCTKTNRSPAIGLRCRGCRTVPEEQLLRPIAGERLVLAKRLRRDSERA